MEKDDFQISNIIKLVFDDIFVKFYDKCFSHPKHYTDNSMLQMLFYEKGLNKDKKDRVVDDIMYEYLIEMKNKTNHHYFILMLKFIILLRECLNTFKAEEAERSDKNQEENGSIVPTNGLGKIKEYSSLFGADSIPDLANEFITEFMENNDYFGIHSEDDRNELIELIQHFCNWLFKNDYTQSRLALMG
jgi:hypothetical protein